MTTSTTSTTSTGDASKPEKFSTNLTYLEGFETLDGWDELAIEETFGRDLAALPYFFKVRAVLWVLMRRAGVESEEAYARIMGMKLGDVDGAYATAPNPADLSKAGQQPPEDDQSPEGKDAEAAGSAPTT